MTARHFSFLVAAVVVALVVVVGLQLLDREPEPSGDPGAGPFPGNPAPDFTLEDLDGNEVSLTSLRGKAVYLNFWATWCPPCVKEMPSVQEVYDKYGDRVAIYAVNVGESRAVVSEFLEENGYTLAVLLDEDKVVAHRYLVRGIPTNIFIDPRGVIVERVTGAMTTSQMERAIEDALE
jgi:thiol-disulfide isomerase/thioredoxin